MSTATPAVVTEEDLLKSINDLTAKPAAVAVVAEPTVEVQVLNKSIDALKGKASAPLLKGLEVSDLLNEVVSLFGAHIDSSLEAMAKSITNGREFNLANIRVLTDLKKSIDANTAAIEKMGDGTVAAPKTITAQPAEVLNKSLTPAKALTAAEMTPEQKAAARRQISFGLEQLAKSFGPNTPESNQWLTAAIKFESTGQISDADLAAAQKKVAGQ